MPEEVVPHNLPAATGAVFEGETEYCGYTVRESSGSGVARVTLYDAVAAPAADTPILEEITLQASESARDHYQHPGRLASIGIWAVIVGQVEGAVFL